LEKANVTWNETEHESQRVYAEKNPAFGANFGPFEAFPCGHLSIQAYPMRYFLASPVTPIGAQFSRLRKKPIGEPMGEWDGSTRDGQDLDLELCWDCLQPQIDAGRAAMIEDAASVQVPAVGG
jgi:hypothetical protein